MAVSLWLSAAMLVSFAFLYTFCVRQHSGRVRTLTDLALTAWLNDVLDDADVHGVVETNLGFGKEFWTVPDGEVSVDRRMRVIVNGKRIISELSVSRTRQALLDSGKTVERMGVRF
jgi:hypothetical protein